MSSWAWRSASRRDTAIRQRRQAAAAPAPVAPAPPGRKIKARLFYVAEDGTRLTSIERDVAYGEGAVEQAREIVAAQIAPVVEPLVSAVPPGTTLRAVFVTRKGEAFVDLSHEVVAAHPGGTLNELLTVYTIVNALTDEPAGRRRRCRCWSTARKSTRWPATSTCGGRSRKASRVGTDNEDMRSDQRPANELRDTTITPELPDARRRIGAHRRAGDTQVICTASVEDRVPPFLRNTGKGWVTAEYGMLPRATSTRMQREASTGKVGGRTQEIQRLIGRSLRSVTNLPALGERTIWIDCDVIQADGGTRTASITGAFVALALALEKLRERDVLRTIPLSDYVAATSVGIVDGEPLLDLAYDDDSRADVDMNIVKTGDGRFIEVQGTAEAIPFGRDALMTLLDLADLGIKQLVEKQRAIVGHLVKTPMTHDRREEPQRSRGPVMHLLCE